MRTIKTLMSFVMALALALVVFGCKSGGYRALKSKSEPFIPAALLLKQAHSALGGVMDKKLAVARRATIEEMNTRPLHIKLRDGAACLFSPFL